MTDLAPMIDKARNLTGAIGTDLAVAGGVLRCSKCSAEQPLGDVGLHLGHGWPACCGQTMTWVTQRQLSAESREVPEGYHLVAVEDTFTFHDPMRVDGTRRCRYMVERRSCGEPSAIAILRGKTRKTWWGYCLPHSFGRWVEGGRVMCWILKADDDG